MITDVHAFADALAPAARLAHALSAPCRPIGLHRFPDGESLPRVAQSGGVAAIYCSLDRPDAKIVPLLLAGDALRRRGAERVVLVAPYLCYLRQDLVFHPGEPLSRDVICGLLGERFDVVVNVEPHMHRTQDLGPPFRGAQVIALSAAEAIADHFAPVAPGTAVVGPDIESGPCVARLAGLLGCDHLTFAKQRHGDREVSLRLPDSASVAGRPVLMLDDICSSGATLEVAARALRSAGATVIDLAVVHALFDSDALDRLRAAGVRRLVSTDSCPHPTNEVDLAATLAAALKELRP